MVTENEQEEVTEVASGGGEVASLEDENASLRRELDNREAEINRLGQALATKDAEIADLGQALHQAKGESADLAKALAEAVAAYKEMVVQANPGILAELITGDTIGDVDESLRNARALMERVRQEMEAEAARTKVPAGAPLRAQLDLSALSAREKIQYAIGGSSS